MSVDNDDDFDFADLLGMSSIINKDEIDENVNTKVLEKKFIKESILGSEVDEDGDNINEYKEYNPLDEYNSIINDIEQNSNIDFEDDYNSNESNTFDTDKSMPLTMSIESNYNSFQKNNLNHNYDDFSSRLTEEQTNQHIVDSVLNLPSKSESSKYIMYDENREDLKLTLLEKIDNLIEELEDEGVNLDKIPKVDFNTDLEKIEYVAKLLMLKVNRNRYSNIGEEFILAIANGLEIFCNGERKIFGIKPDLTHCTDIVKVKLRRIKGETSQIVSNVVEKYEISPLLTVMIELMPALFLHSRRRNSQKSNKIYLNAEDDINEIRKFT